MDLALFLLVYFKGIFKKLMLPLGMGSLDFVFLQKKSIWEWKESKSWKNMREKKKRNSKSKMRWYRRKMGENVIFIECLCDKPCSRGGHKHHYMQFFYQVAHLRKWNLKSSVRKPGTGSGKRAGLKWDLGIHPRFHSHQLCGFCSSHLITFFACKTCIISAQVIVRINWNNVSKVSVTLDAILHKCQFPPRHPSSHLSPSSCQGKVRICSEQHEAFMSICKGMFVPWEPYTQTYTVDEIVVRSHDLSLKKTHKSLKKKSFLQKEALLECESLFKSKSLVRNMLSFCPNNSFLSWDNAGYIALESIESPWQWQRFLPGTLETVWRNTWPRALAIDKKFVPSLSSRT